MPGRIERGVARARARMRDAASGKHDECPARIEPFARGAQACTASCGRGRAAKRIDEEAEIREVLDMREQVTGQHADVASALMNEVRQREAVEHAMRMIRDDEQRAGCGKSCEIAAFQHDVDVQRLQRPRRERLSGSVCGVLMQSSIRRQPQRPVEEGPRDAEAPRGAGGTRRRGSESRSPRPLDVAQVPLFRSPPTPIARDRPTVPSAQTHGGGASSGPGARGADESSRRSA